MAILKKIVVRDFRNIQLQELEFSPKVNCITGDNGEGKTNLLDAIWYLSMTKSAFSTSDRFNFRHGCDSFALSGNYDMPDGKKLRISIESAAGSEKKVKKDDKLYQRISEHIGLLPIVMVSPADVTMVSDSGDERRKFANAVLSQTSATYLADVQQYNRLLLQRNSLLKSTVSPDYGLLDVLDAQMDAPAARIHSARREFIEGLVPAVQKCYELISGGSEQVGIDYKSDLCNTTLTELLKAGRDKDSALRYTSAGPQRDDFIFTMDGFPIRRCGSQGQQKSFLVALKFAQYEMMKRECGSAPMLLLDDVFDKLDLKRVRNLLQMVSENDFGQIFISDANKARTKSTMEGITEKCRYYVARGGVFANE